MKARFYSCVALCAAAQLAPMAFAQSSKCKDLPTASQLKTYLNSLDSVPADLGGGGGQIGGLFNGTRMWASVVNRDGEICATAAGTSDPSQVWPGSQAIAKAKAYTANAFSLDDFALSTARLYTFTQPGRSLWSLGQSNLFNSDALVAPDRSNQTDNKTAGGLIFFGGGVPLYKGGKIVGGLGISGDTSCADHEVAKRVRHLASLNPAAGAKADDISYSSVDGASAVTHPLCINTYRNGGNLLGQEQPAVGY